MISLTLVPSSGLMAAPVSLEGNLPAQQFEPLSGGRHDFITTLGTRTLPHLDITTGVILGYANRPLSVRYSTTDQVTDVLVHQYQANLVGGIGLTQWLELGFAIPVHMTSPGEVTSSLSEKDLPSSTSIGDVRLVPRARLISPDSGSGLGLALLAVASLPTGDPHGFASNAFPTLEPRVALEFDSRRVRLGANVGYLIRQEESLAGFKVGDEVTLKAACEIPLTHRSMRLITEFTGKTAANGEGLLQPDSSPAEVLMAAQWSTPSGHRWMLGGGAGLTSGYGTPVWRSFLAYTFSPWDPVMHSRSPMPKPVGAPAELSPPPPMEEEEEIQVAVAEPEPPAVVCPVVHTPSGQVDEHGCPIEAREEAVVVDRSIVIYQRVFFEFDRAELMSESEGILNKVAELLKENAHVERVEIQGHTDDQGGHAYNMRLSQNRAAAVRDYLIKRGVHPQRLTARGYGLTEPLEEGVSEEARSRNRRVEFLILEQSEPSPQS